MFLARKTATENPAAAGRARPKKTRAATTNKIPKAALHFNGRIRIRTRVAEGKHKWVGGLLGPFNTPSGRTFPLLASKPGFWVLPWPEGT